MSKTRTQNAALVTGSSKRIGRALIEYLSSQDYLVIIHYNKSRNDAIKLRDQIKAKGGFAETVYCNLSNLKSASTLIKKCKTKHRNLNLLINNASTFKPSTLKNSNEQLIERDFNSNLFAPLLLSRDFGKYCKKGNIINISDTNITKNKSHSFLYLLAKKSLVELTKMSAIELAPNIRVNAIAPGLILPPVNKGTDHLKRLSKTVPLKKKGSPCNIIQSVDFILKNDYLNGQVLFNDGGEHLT